ncbi:MAG: hypothetical protein ACRYFW_05320 [Janthinobacterium lividum]
MARTDEAAGGCAAARLRGWAAPSRSSERSYFDRRVRRVLAAFSRGG